MAKVLKGPRCYICSKKGDVIVRIGWDDVSSLTVHKIRCVRTFFDNNPIVAQNDKLTIIEL